MSDMAGKAAKGSGRAERERARYNGARGTRDIEGKVTRVGASKPGGERVSIMKECPSAAGNRRHSRLVKADSAP